MILLLLSEPVEGIVLFPSHVAAFLFCVIEWIPSLGGCRGFTVLDFCLLYFFVASFLLNYFLIFFFVCDGIVHFSSSVVYGDVA